MKYLILSDIHGSKRALEPLIHLFTEDNYDYLVILGDILYHGPRNSIPEGYDPQGVVSLLNPLSDKIIACRGNCDAEVDQMLLKFNCLNDYARIFDEGKSWFITHGHLYTKENIDNTLTTDLFFYGHTHLWELEKIESHYICNPGSITFPKENRPATYATYEQKVLKIYTTAGECLKELTIN